MASEITVATKDEKTPKQVHFSYDSEFDILTLRFREPVGVIEGVDVVPGAVMLEYDEENHVVGIEIFDVKAFMAKRRGTIVE